MQSPLLRYSLVLLGALVPLYALGFLVDIPLITRYLDEPILFLTVCAVGGYATERMGVTYREDAPTVLGIAVVLLTLFALYVVLDLFAPLT